MFFFCFFLDIFLVSNSHAVTFILSPRRLSWAPEHLVNCSRLIEVNGLSFLPSSHRPLLHIHTPEFSTQFKGEDSSISSLAYVNNHRHTAMPPARQRTNGDGTKSEINKGRASGASRRPRGGAAAASNANAEQSQQGKDAGRQNAHSTAKNNAAGGSGQAGKTTPASVGVCYLLMRTRPFHWSLFRHRTVGLF